MGLIRKTVLLHGNHSSCPLPGIQLTTRQSLNKERHPLERQSLHKTKPLSSNADAITPSIVRLRFFHRKFFIVAYTSAALRILFFENAEGKHS